MKIFIGNLPFNATPEDLKNALDEFGDVVELDLVTDRQSGQSKGFAFIQMGSNSEADKVIKGLNGSKFMERVLKVNQVQPKKPEKNKRRRRF